MAAAPTSLYLHTMIHDPLRDRVIVFGGLDYNSYSSHVWSFSLSSHEWALLPAAGPGPGERIGHSAVYDPVRDRMVVFGGYNGNGVLNDVWQLSLSGFPTWSPLAVTGTPPVPRYLQSAIYDPVRDRLMVFGGYSDSGRLNDVWVLPLSGESAWSLLDTGPTTLTPRQEHTAIYDPVGDRMIVAGGFADGPASQDLCFLSLAGTPTWTCMEPPGGAPAHRADHAAIYDATGKRMILFAGGNNSILNDTWALGLEGAPAWVALTPAPPMPSPRIFPAASYDPIRHQMVVFGGLSFVEEDARVWTLSLDASPAWTPYDPPPPPPGAPDPYVAEPGGLPVSIYVGQSFTLAILAGNAGGASDDGRVVVGFPSLTGVNDGQWITSTSSGDAPGFRTMPAESQIERADCQPMTASYLVAEYADDDWGSTEENALEITVRPPEAGAFIVDIRSTMHFGGACDWVNDIPSASGATQNDQQGWAVRRYVVTVLPVPPEGTPPSARFRHTAVHDAAGARMLVFGGVSNQPLSDVWSLSLDASPQWTLILPEGATPSARYGHAAVLDPVRNRMIVFGGASYGGEVNDVWALSLTVPPSWTALATQGTPPPPRSGHTAIYDPVRDRILVYGGVGLEVFGDVWALSLAGTPTWTEISPPGAPDPRLLHSAIYDPVRDRMLVYGGYGSAPTDADVWSLNLAGAPSWSRLNFAPDSIPLPRVGATLTYDPAGDRAWLVGGSGYQFYDDVWTLELTSQPVWRQQLTWGTPMPVRWTHTTIADPVHERLVTFGGEFGGPLNDTWLLSTSGLPAWSELGGVPPPPPPSAPVPTFADSGLGLPASLVLGQAFTFTVSVRNQGLASDDGRIVVSFPSFTDPGDGQWVSASAGGDTPGYSETPAGGTLDNASCQPISASYLASEYADDDWRALGLETNYLTLTVQPRALGPFVIDVRSSMHRAGGAACEIANGVPSEGEAGHVDQQGWEVRRFTVEVVPPPTKPAPVFTTAVAAIPASIPLGQTFTLTLEVQNDGAASDDGRIVVGFPGFTGPSDDVRVSSNSSGDLPGYGEVVAGGALVGPSCQPLTASYLMVEYADSDWLWIGTEHNTLVLTVQPTAIGTFAFDVRATMHVTGGGPCAYVNGVPSGGQAFTDQQGWEVRRFEVTVLPPPPDPTFTGNVNLNPVSVLLGQTFTLTTTVRNQGTASDDGRVVVSFPSLTGASDDQWVSSTTAGDTPGYSEHPSGSTILSQSCSPVTASCLMVEYADNDWRGGGSEGNQLVLTVQPQTTGNFQILIRSTMHITGDLPCAYVNDVPPNGTIGTDQQGWTVRVLNVSVNSGPSTTPAPFFTTAVTGLPSEINLGDPISMFCTVRNNGALADDGRIHFGFPTLVGTGDHQWVSSTTSGATPGYVEQPAGTIVQSAICQDIYAPYLIAEYRDNAWNPNEVTTFNIVAQPQVTGTFRIQVRATMHGQNAAPCDIVNALPSISGSSTQVLDAQGWMTREYSVTVNPAPPSPTPTPVFTAPVLGLPTVITLGESFTFAASVRNDAAASDDAVISFAFPSFMNPGDGAWIAPATSADAAGYRERLPGSPITNAACQTIGADHLAVEYADTAWAQGEIHTLSAFVQPRAVGTFYIDVRTTFHTPGLGCAYTNSLPPGGAIGPTDQQGWAVRRFAVEVVAPAGPPPQISAAWSLITPPPGGPAGRTQATAIYHPGRDAMIIYGGQDPEYPEEVWYLPFTQGSAWTLLVAGGPLPQRRTQHSTIYNPVDDQSVIFGGFYDRYLNDMTVLALGAQPWWFPNPGFGTPPSKRGGHAAVYDPVRHRMLVIGGYDEFGTLRNDVWEYAPPGVGTWRQLQPQGGPMPPRFQHAAVYDPVRDRVLVVGGDGGTMLGDVWALHLSGTLAWEQLTPAGTPPSARREHVMVYDAAGDRMLMFGGFDGGRRGDLWELRLGSGPVWARIGAANLAPALRIGHVGVFDPGRRRLVVYGGDVGTNELSAEIWALSLEPPTPVTVALASAEATPDRVRLAWTLAGAGIVRTEVSRSVEGSAEWVTLGSATRDGDRLTFEDRAVVPGTRYGYRLAVWEGSEETRTEPVWVAVPKPAILGLAGAFPNPADRIVSVAFSLPGDQAATLELYDLKGRRVAWREVGALGAGEHRVDLADARDLPAGIYLVRLRHQRGTLTAKACVVR
ncbi:MAG TPA: kelch repeat-containing protein [Candidatus Eisenbacteria bacterium]|nr:kelch repeat-containing protein [Candidatus Eisenbacteria bacterium]